jgi:hypothetical protein
VSRRGDPARKNKLGVRYDEPQTSVSPAGGARMSLSPVRYRLRVRAIQKLRSFNEGRWHSCSKHLICSIYDGVVFDQAPARRFPRELLFRQAIEAPSKRRSAR